MDRNVDRSAPRLTSHLQVRRLVGGFCALFGLACLIALGALFNIAATLDRQEQERSSFHATQALEQRLLASRQFLSSYAVWDAAYEHLVGKVDWQWAYEEKNVGESLYSASGYEGVFVVEDGGTTYALFKGKPTDSPATAYLDAPLAPILAQARSTQRQPVNRSPSSCASTAGRRCSAPPQYAQTRMCSKARSARHPSCCSSTS
jgi:sensor domain CHASE-containing protein